MRTKFARLSALACALLGALFFAPDIAQAQGTAKPKASLNSEISQQFPDNIVGLITPQSARAVTQDFVASFQQAPQVNLQTGTTYTVQASDYGQAVRFNSANPVAVTIPQATGSFAVFSVYINQAGVGAVTITPASGTIDGGANYQLTQGQTVVVVSDGTNWQVFLKGITGVTNIGGAQNALGLNGDLAVITGTTSTNGPYTAGATTITVTSLKGMSVGQSIALHYDDATTQTVTVTALGNSQLGATVTFTPAISGGKTLSATDQVTWSQVLAFNSDYFPPYDPTGFGSSTSGHNIAWLDADWNVFTGNQMGLKSADYSINGSITSFCGSSTGSSSNCNQGPASADTTTVVIANGSAVLCAAASASAGTISVVSGNSLTGIIGQSVTIHLNSGTQTVLIDNAVQGTATSTCGGVTVGTGLWTLTPHVVTTGAAAAGNLIDLPIPNFSFQVAKAAATTGNNPSSVTVSSSIQIPASDTVYFTLSDASTFTATVSSMVSVGGCTAGSAPCTWTINFAPQVGGGRTINSGAAVYWNYSYSASTAAAVPSDTLATLLRKIANGINANSRVAASGTQAVLQGVGTNSGTLIIEPKRFGPTRPVPTIAVFESPAGSGHLLVPSYSQPANNLDGASILTLSRNAAGYAPQSGDLVGFIQMSGITDDGTWLCCTAQYGGILTYVVNPTPGASLLGRMVFNTAGNYGVNTRLQIKNGLALFYDNGTSMVVASGDDQGAGSINAGPLGYYVQGVPLGRPAFLATRTANQSVSQATATEIAFNSSTDFGGAFFNTGNGRFTPPAGTYQFCASVTATGTVTLAGHEATYELFIKKNGATVLATPITSMPASGSATFGALGPCVVTTMTGTDYVSVFAYIDAASPAVVGGANNNSIFTGTRIGM